MKINITGEAKLIKVDCPHDNIEIDLDIAK